MRPSGTQRLRWRGRTFTVDHEDIVGWVVVEDSNFIGESFLTLGLMRRDGVLVRQVEWPLYGVEVDPS